MPLLLKSYLPPTPDLIIDNFTASSESIEITIKNVGDAPVIDAFWVQVIIDPTTPPTTVNQRWDALSDKGAFWGVINPAIPLDSNEAFTLRLNDEYYYTGNPTNNIPNPLPPSSIIYAQIDAINFLTTYGNVREIDETNNIISTVSVLGGDLNTVSVPGGIFSSPSSVGLPSLNE